MAKKKHELNFAGSQEALWKPNIWSSFGFHCTIVGPPVRATAQQVSRLPVVFAIPVQIGDEMVPAGRAVETTAHSVFPIGIVARALYVMEDDDAARDA